VSTTYDDEDFISFEFDLGGETPAIDFEETKLIDKELGLLTRSERVYSFKMNKPELQINLYQETAQPEELMGTVDV
jgi:hypothetical protein